MSEYIIIWKEKLSKMVDIKYINGFQLNNKKDAQNNCLKETKKIS